MASNESSIFNLEELSSKFQWPEYVVFGLMLVISTGIGIFYGCIGKNTESTKEFLMAGRSMSTFPVAMSVLASFTSAITLLGMPAEMYEYGTQFWIAFISYALVMLAAAFIYMPTFYDLQLTSVYEYLELRFSKSIRLLGSATFIVQMTLYMAIVVYAPALALSQVTGMNVYMATTGIFVVCIFYTALGGMKAVIFTDLFQVIIMFAAMILVTIKGTADVGGYDAVWEAARNGSRVEFFNFNLDPRDRHTVFSLVIGGYFTWVTIYGTNQAQVQRYLTLPSKKMAQRAILINYIGLSSLLCIVCYGGLILYAKYANCDPILSKKVKSPDQVFPLFVMDTLGEYSGLPGLFVAGVFSGALSTVSSGLNSLAAISLEDFIKPRWVNLDDKTATTISRYLAVGFGVLCYALTFVAAHLGGVLQAALVIFGVVGGPLLGLFTLGLCFPWANAKGALIGTLTSLGFTMWLGFGTMVAVSNKSVVIPKKPFSVSHCNFNVTLAPPIIGQTGGILEFYRLSYMWYSLIGCTVVIIVGLISSFLTGSQNPRKLSPILISPLVNDVINFVVPQNLRKKIGWEIGLDLDSSLEKGKAALFAGNSASQNGLKDETKF